MICYDPSPSSHLFTLRSCYFISRCILVCFRSWGWAGRGGGCWGWDWGWGEGNTIYGIVRMCVPNGPFFQRCQVYDWPLFFNKKYMNDPIFLDFCVKGPIFLTSWYMHILFAQRFFEAALVLLVSNELTLIFVYKPAINGYKISNGSI